MFFYIAINVSIYFTKDHLTIYEVKEGSTAQNNLITGLILRNETVINSDKAGYITYFQKEGSRVAKNASIFSVDDNNQIMDVLTNGDNPVTISKKNNDELQYDIQAFKKSFSDENFDEVYQLKENAQSTVLDILNTTLIEQSQKIQKESGVTYSYHNYESQTSGIISYYLDTYEAITPETVHLQLFENEDFERTSLRTPEMVSINSPICKIIATDLWYIILPLTPEQYAKLDGKDQVKFTITKDDYKTSAKLDLFQNNGDYFAKITMEKLLSNYLNDRFLEVEVDFDTVEGLKIPLSSIVDKNFYLVPLDYFTKGANSDKDGLSLEEIDKKSGEISYKFVPTDIYYQDETYAYVDTRQFEIGSTIKKPDSSDQYKLSQMDQLTGVYNVNTGYAVFKRIKILYQNDEYCIIEKNTKNGLSVYDHIALIGTTAEEQEIIY
jgi:hypothetical protein